MDFADRLRAIRTERKLTQEQVAGMVGVSRVSVGFYERGRVPSLRMIKKLADALAVPVDYLINCPETTPADKTKHRLWLEFAYALESAGALARQIAECEPENITLTLDAKAFAKAAVGAIHDNREG